MLDVTTKRKIDSARQILVGKVPDPKAQVEQITTALVYKFMDDMDKESQELGGQTRFFANGFEKYSWTKLLDKRLSGAERLDLYVQAITNMSKNPHIPQLFKDIFKGAALPYNDAQTLNLFLKEIDGFTFDHSEDLGDAYEYLLNVVGTSGEAGQFRTPRHIIDFIVEVVAPKKNETILDPACGTAGFLISAYKHILRQHDGKNDQTGEPTSAEKRLSPEEKQKMMSNFVGYDIDPGMMRIAIVNMYLHHFPNPKIYEYDTLTYEDRWDDTFDVILANPPFMTPKGGIRPHKRFSVQATRSEVLFVDYILEHLNIKGRAGIIVPEGVIFRNDSAYKELRKKLVEDGLYAVVSLPQGVFAKPGGKGNVKMSILFFDNQLAKKSGEILFVRVENDGFDLGAQRRKIDKNDLPEAMAILDAWKSGKKQSSDLALWVKKEKIAESGNYRLSGEFYRENVSKLHQKWPMVELGQVLDYEQPTKYIVESVDYDDKHTTPVLTAGKTFILGYTNEKSGVFPQEKLPVIIFDDFTTASKFVDFSFKVKSSAMKILLADKSKANIKFLFHSIQRIAFTVNEHKRYWISEYSKIKIPLPPLDVQNEIVEQIEAKENSIKHAKEIIKNLERERRYFGQSLRKLKDVEWVVLGEIFEKVNKQINPQNGAGKTVYVGLENIESNSGNLVGEVDAEMKSIRSTKTVFTKGDILYGKLRPNLNKVWFADRDGICSTDILVLRSRSEKIIAGLYALILRNDEFNAEVLKGLKGAQLPRVSFEYLASLKIPFIPLETQKQLVAEAEQEEEIITANRRLIDLMERKIDDVLSEI
jgi:type I restriction enzyme M protein